MNIEPESYHRLPPTARNPKTAARFRRESWWQITFPVLVVAVLMLGCAAATFVLSGSAGVSIVADYSLILLSVPTLIVGLIVLVITVAITYVIMLLLRHIPPYAFIAQQHVQNARDGVVSFMGKITGAMIGFLSVLSGIGLFLKQVGIMADNHADGSSGPTEPGSGL